MARVKKKKEEFKRNKTVKIVNSKKFDRKMILTHLNRSLTQLKLMDVQKAILLVKVLRLKSYHKE